MLFVLEKPVLFLPIREMNINVIAGWRHLPHPLHWFIYLQISNILTY